MIIASPIEILQAAALRMNENPIPTSIEEGSNMSRVFRGNYETIVRKRLSAHSWSFASYPVKLVYQGEAEVGSFRHAFLMPPEALTLHWVGKERSRSTQWKLHKGKVLLPYQDEYEAIISHRAPESDWSAPFVDAMIEEIKVLFIETFQKNPETARILRKDVEALFRSAMALDKRQSPGPKATRDGSLIEARRFGGTPLTGG